MATTIKLKRGSGSDPSASDLSVGEIAIRTDSGKLFTKKDNGSVAEISGSGGIDDGDKGDITVSNSGATFTIDNGVISTAKIADDAVTNAKIGAGAVGTTELDTGAITTAKLADDAVTTAKIGAGAVGTTELDTGAVTATQLAANAVTNAKISSGAVGTNELDTGAVTTAKIADGTIVNADISGSAAIEGSKLQAAGLINAGSMSAANFNKLAGIEANATADMTATEVLSLISGQNIILGEIASTGNSSFAGNITISSSDGGSAAAPELELNRNSASPADADYLGQIKFTGESDDDSKEVYAKITGKIGDASSGTEDGILEFAFRKAGSNNICARFTSETLKLINGTSLEVAGGTSDDTSLTSPKILGSNGIMEMKQEIGTSHTLTSGYNAIAVDPTIANGVTVTVPSGATWSIV